MVCECVYVRVTIQYWLNKYYGSSRQPKRKHEISTVKSLIYLSMCKNVHMCTLIIDNHVEIYFFRMNYYAMNHQNRLINFNFRNAHSKYS